MEQEDGNKAGLVICGYFMADERKEHNDRTGTPAESATEHTGG